MSPARTTKNRSLDIATAMGIDLSPQTRGVWEGSFLHTTSTPNESYFMRASIGMVRGALEGDARMSPDAKDERFVEAELAGAVEGRQIEFTVWVQTGQQPEPFTCTARLNPRANMIRGTWRHPCYAGKSCNCEGGGGIFELRRLPD
ncbi:MAG TPA: hypothetical protein VG942_17910 [Hyphomonadaceae bacterium]|nr:hypothetical protein [Hyphomonadaceae bacterium]